MDPIAALLPLFRTLANKVRLPAGCILSREDLVQEAFLALVRAMPRCRSKDHPGRQTFIIVRALGAMRSAVRNAEHSRSLRQHLDMPLDERAAPAEDLDLQITVRDVTAGLRSKDASVVSHWTEGRTVPELAAELGMTGDGVHWRLVQAREALRLLLWSVVA